MPDHTKLQTKAAGEAVRKGQDMPFKEILQRAQRVRHVVMVESGLFGTAIELESPAPGESIGEAITTGSAAG